MEPPPDFAIRRWVDHGPDPVEALWQRHHQEYASRLENELIPLARAARDRFADSHRHFLVGCAILAWNESNGRYEVFVAGNNTPEANLGRTGEDKRRAEREAVSMLKEETDGNWHIVAIVTVTAETSTEPNDKSNEHGVLNPCNDCKKMMASSKLIDEKTIVCNVNDTRLVDETTRVKILEPEDMLREEKTVKDLPPILNIPK